MNINLSILDLFTLIGNTTGIVCSIILLSKSHKKKSNIFLGLGILSFVWLTTKILFHSFNIWETHGVGFFPNSVELVIAPLFYFYALSLVDINFNFERKYLLHFVPFFISQSYSVIVYVVTMQTEIFNEKYVIAQAYYFNEMKNLDEYLLILTSVFYFYYGYKHIQINTQNFDTISKTQTHELKFLKTLFVLLVTLSIIHISNLALNTVMNSTYHWRWNLIHAVVAICIYYISIIGFKHADIIHLKKSIPKKIAIDYSIIDSIGKLIQNEKVHLNPKLSLKGLALQLNVSEVTLSNTINSHYKKNFRSLINEARVQEVKERLLNGELENLSLLGIAKECGFNSEASFYRIFKHETKTTPKQFISNSLNIERTA